MERNHKIIYKKRKLKPEAIEMENECSKYKVSIKTAKKTNSKFSKVQVVQIKFSNSFLLP